MALIGVSGYGRIYLQLLQECQALGRLKLVAAVIINPEEERDTLSWLTARGCRVYTHYEQMLMEEAGRVDLCLVPTGIHWHARMTVAALRNGANVLVEKPLCASMAEVAPSACPSMDLVEETSSRSACSPKTARIARVSATSPSGVEVPWALM